MFSIGKRNKKFIAAVFLLLLTVQTFYPAAAYALTSGPTQPEMQKFQPAGVTNMVDPFSGDFKYDIALLDVGGYPVNLSYHSGTGMEDEASWVGMGWSLNPGAVNRTMRGIPDDFTGKPTGTGDVPDMITSTQYKKDFYKIGGQIVVKPTIFGLEAGKASLHLGVYKDNYYGIGGELGASLSFTLAEAGATSLTAGLGLNSDSRTGVTVSPSLSLSAQYDDCKELNAGTLTGGFSYNTRSGLEEVNLGASFGAKAALYDDYGRQTGTAGAEIGVGSFNKYFVHTYTPTYGTSTTSSNKTFSFDVGGAFFGFYAGFGGSGYIYTEKNNEVTTTLPAFGYLNYAAGARNTNAILDFNREKDGPFIQNTPAIPIPVSTEDYFTATSQAGVQQFRPHFNGEYTIFDRTYTNNSSSLGLGVTLGFGEAFQAGARVDATSSGAGSYTRRWDNLYTTTADGGMPATLGPNGKMPEATWFKKVGEFSAPDQVYYNNLFNDNTQKVSLDAGFSSKSNTKAAVVINGVSNNVLNLRRDHRDIRTSPFGYLTAKEASVYGLDQQINGQYQRMDAAHKAHHISEVTVTDEVGKRMVYGIPVYNMDQEEVSFSVGAQSDIYNPFSTARKTGLVDYNQDPSHPETSTSNNKGRANIYDRKSIPPYATSFLLTGILSADYVDRTGDGITDDDRGTAIKFGYQRTTTNYKWRAPFENKASYNEGFLSDGKDDKGNYVYGTKELWYLNQIENKTMVAKFFTSPREDGFGVAGEQGGRGGSDQTVMKLDSIQLFSKADIAKNGIQAAIPIKVVHFEYDYSLYPGVPNNSFTPKMGRDPLVPYGPYNAGDPYDLTGHTIDLNAQHGKLTLRKVWFTFSSSARGRSNPYIFSYDMRTTSDPSFGNLATQTGTPTDPAEANETYTQRQTDRWGTYKPSYYNRIVGGVSRMNNAEYPYALQASNDESYDNHLLANHFASKWQLSTITTPTGGKIMVDYESDDYSYVQDRKAMREYQLIGVGGSTPSATGMIKAGKLYVKVPVAPTSQQDFINTYLSGPNGQNWSNVGFKIYTDVDNHGHYEYVYGYAEIDYNNSNNPWSVSSGNNVVGIPVKSVNGYNPVSKAAWQMLQTDLPQYAYENYDNSDASGFGGDVIAAVKSIITAFTNLRELGQSFDQTANGKNYASKVIPEMSQVRLNTPVGKFIKSSVAADTTFGKLGGGSRVRRVEISDTWSDMVGSGAKTQVNGIRFEYTTADDAGNKISSGVAAYEPGIGNEENPFHEPVNYTEKVQWSQDRYHYVEKPYGESYFPAPEVGYSEVKATVYGADKPYNQSPTISQTGTGYTLDRFYTAKDFPTLVDYLPLDERTAENDLTLLLFASRYTQRVATSQGFKVELNDMHGKPKFTGIYDNGGALISSSEYSYSVVSDNAPRKQLYNTVLALGSDGTIPTAGTLLGTDEDLVTDIRESSSSTSGTSIGAYVGGFWIIWPMPYGFVNYNNTASTRSYNSISTIKVIHRYGLLKETKTTQNGSTLTADNLLWDGVTGQVMLTRTQNEFDDYTYSLVYPAYMAYDGMGGAYQNAGTLFAGLTVGSSGSLLSGFESYLAPGDELVNVDVTDPQNPIHGWVIPTPSGTSYNLIDKAGNFITTAGNYRLVRSGRRNMLGTSAGTLVTMNNPLMQSGSVYTLNTGVDRRILTAKAETYKDEWDQPIPKFLTTTAASTETDSWYPSGGFGSGHSQGIYFSTIYKLATALFTMNPATGRLYAYSYAADNVSLGLMFNTAIQNGTLSSTDVNNFFMNCNATGVVPAPALSQLSYALVTQRSVGSTYTIRNGDIANVTLNGVHLGVITFDNMPSTQLVSMPTQCSSAATSQNTCGGYVNNFMSSTNDCTNQDVVISWQPVPIAMQIPPTSTCTDPVNQVINPYYQDIKGVWREDYAHVYQVNRTQAPGNTGQTGGTNIRYSGYYNGFTPFWMINGRGLTPMAEVSNTPVQHTLSDSRWEWNNRAIHFDPKGNEIENVDALKRYGAALYGYDLTVPTAVADNARQNEIAYDGFEDYYFSTQPVNPMSQPAPCPQKRHLDLGFPLLSSGLPMNTPDGSSLVTKPVHSGNYSLKLNSLNINQPLVGTKDPPPGSVVGLNGAGQYLLLSNEQAAGFAPIPQKDYLLSFWVNDEAPVTRNTISGLTATVNNQSFDFSNYTATVVDGWKKVEIRFTGQASGFTLQLSGGGNIYIDDLRIQPYNSHMKSFVYDDRTMRLTGQLDENNFGVFYEYDEEGTPIRTKKETEKGIMTIKENRQAYKKYIQTSN